MVLTCLQIIIRKLQTLNSGFRVVENCINEIENSRDFMTLNKPSYNTF